MLNGGSLFDRNVVQLVVQDPYQSFNPSVKVKTSFRENVRAASELCKNFGLDAALLERLPRELSGGE